MTNDNKSSIFGPTGTIDLSTYEPRSGKTILKAVTDVASSANKSVEAETLIGNTSSVLFRFDPPNGGSPS